MRLYIPLHFPPFPSISFPIPMFYLIALLEGFTTLSIQMIALRLATPVVGSSIILTSVFIGVILLALSTWYRLWWYVASHYKKQTLRYILAWFLLFSTLYYWIITFGFEEPLIEALINSSGNYVFALFFGAFVLFFLPVMIDAQTLPLLTELIPEESKGKAAWSMLFASTIGSFLGSVGTSVRLFEWRWVRNTAVFTCALLFICITLLLRNHARKRARATILWWSLFCLFIRWWYHQFYKHISWLVTYQDTAYQEVIVRTMNREDNKPVKIFHTNRAFASGIYTDTKESPFQYLKEIQTITEQIKPKRVLVIWTAWFTFPHRLSKLDYVEQVDAIDIDGALKEIAEKHFLEETLSPKITFYPDSARYFINKAIKEWKSYDLILLDAYNGKTLPDELATVEFFDWIKRSTTTNWIATANFILDSNLDSNLTRNLLSTRNYVFTTTWTKNASKNPQHNFDNFIVTTRPFDDFYKNFTNFWQLYTDDLRTTETDLAMMWWKE